MTKTISTRISEHISLEAYIEGFTKAYHEKNRFKKIVHKYLNMSIFRKFSVGLKKRFSKKSYIKETNDIIKEYATKIYEKTRKDAEIDKGLAEIENTNSEIDHIEDGLEGVLLKKNAAATEYLDTNKKKEEAIANTHNEFEEKKTNEEMLAEQEKEAIQRETDVEVITKEKLKEYLLNQDTIEVSEDGIVNFHSGNIMKAFEKKFLNLIVDGIERDSGERGFMSTAKGIYDGTIAYYAEMDDYSELGRVDWVQTMINTRLYGYKRPMRPDHFIVGKLEGFARTTVDSATIIDTSGSMNHNYRFLAAKEAGLASKAMMSELNPDNNSYLALFNNDVWEVTSEELYKTTCPRWAGTETDLALDWLFDTLVGKLSIAQLITDGEPNSVNDAVKSAQRFRDHPYIKLVIYLVDGDRSSKEATRKIGMAAGPETKIIQLNNYIPKRNPLGRDNTLGKSIIKNIPEAISEMMSVEAF